MALEEDDVYYYVDGVLVEYGRIVLARLDNYVGSIGKYYVGHRSIDRRGVK
jgi:hypothetical protein